MLFAPSLLFSEGALVSKINLHSLGAGFVFVALAVTSIYYLPTSSVYFAKSISNFLETPLTE